MGLSKTDIQDLYEYCSTRDITIHSSIRPTHVPGCGLGIYAEKQLEADEKLVHIPTNNIFTTNNIPDHFLTRSVRDDIAVHAQLAAFFAFGAETDLEAYEPWLRTWPAFEDFFHSMPIFWGDLLESEIRDNVRSDDGSEIRPVRTASKRSGPHLDSKKSSPPKSALTKAALLDRRAWASKVVSLGTVLDQTVQMIEKLVSHIRSIHLALPGLDLLGNPNLMTKFLHAWCLVNTRCFYYVLPVRSQKKIKGPKPKAPIDPNEAMGLCPFMDLFNHTAPATVSGASHPKPCMVKSGSAGFTAVTVSKIQAGTEVLFSYGSHTNDTLWSEYGFLLPGSSNTSDSILLDLFVLNGLTSEQCSTLEEHDYLGSYTLFNDGSVCYRTEMTAWLPILGVQNWTKAVTESLDPADLVSSAVLTSSEVTRNYGSQTRSRSVINAKQQHGRITEGWLVAVQEQAQVDVAYLKAFSEADVLELFKTSSILVESSYGSKACLPSLARARQSTCVDRCEQIAAMAARGVEAVTADSREEL